MTTREQPIRRLAQSTRQALTARVAPGGALNFANRLNAQFQSAASAAGQSTPTTGTDNRVGFGNSLVAAPLIAGAANLFGNTSPDPVDGSAITRIAEGVRGTIGDLQEDARPIDDPDQTGDLLDQLQQDIARHIAARDEAIAQGRSDIADQYDDQIAKLRDQQAKLRAGRDRINAAYLSNQDSLAAQQASLQAEQIGATGTDIQGEVGKVSTIYDQGSTELNEFFDKMGADSPVLAEQLAADSRQFQFLAEQSLRENLGNQAAVTRAAGLFAQKAGEQMLAEGRVDAEQGRSEIEGKINARLDGLAQQIKDTENAKNDAIDKMLAEVGDYDDEWLGDFEAVWGVYSDKWFEEKGLSHDEEAQLRSMFEEVYPQLADRGRAGATEWAKNDRYEKNWGIVLDALKMKDIDALVASGLLNEAQVSALDKALSSGGTTEGLQHVLGNAYDARLADLDYLEDEDYNDLIDLIDARVEFDQGGYDDFVANTRAQLSGSGLADSVNGADLTSKDMTKTNANGSVVYVHPGAASSFDEMIADAAKHGINLRVGDSYRSWATQKKAYDNFKRTQGTCAGKPASYGKNLNGDCVPNIANPNNSNHPKGLAIDFTFRGRNDPAFKWLTTFGNSYGWYGIGSEEWHWEYRGDIANPKSDTPTTAPQDPREGPGGSGR